MRKSSSLCCPVIFFPTDARTRGALWGLVLRRLCVCLVFFYHGIWKTLRLSSSWISMTDLDSTVSFGGGGFGGGGGRGPVSAYGYSGRERNPHTAPAVGPAPHGSQRGNFDFNNSGSQLDELGIASGVVGLGAAATGYGAVSLGATVVGLGAGIAGY